VGALDQARDIGHHERLEASGAHHAQVRRQCGEGVVGDLRLRGGDPRDQRALPGIGHSHQAHVGKEPQLEEESPLFAGRAGLAVPGRLVGRGGKAGVSTSSATAPGCGPSRAWIHEICQELVIFVVHVGARRHLDHEVLPAAPMLILPPAVLAPLGAKVLAESKGGQGGEGRVHFHDHAAPVTAVAAVGAAARRGSRRLRGLPGA
jgi:hypothetical protein